MENSHSHRSSGNGLALLANKCAACTFDISSGMAYASIRDQIVRAQLLIRDLKLSDPMCRKVLIVGAGVAGIAAAACASELEIQTVVLETNKNPFQLQLGVKTRMVGPFMYEWPSALSNSQAYPHLTLRIGDAMNCTPKWDADEPIEANELVEKLTAWLDGHDFNNTKPNFVYGIAPDIARSYVEKFVQHHSKLGMAGARRESPTLTVKGELLRSSIDGVVSNDLAFEPDYIILAVGMGAERVNLIDDVHGGVEGAPFWSNDDLRVHLRMDSQIGVFGGGDGALQDILRLITKHDHPLSLIKALEHGDDSIKQELDIIRPQLETLEQQSRLLATWSSGLVYDLIDSQCQKLCEALAKKEHVVGKVLCQVREGSGHVYHVHVERCFGKAYLLNRFCTHLVEQCCRAQRIDGFVRYERIAGVKATKATKSGKSYIVLLSDARTLRLDQIVVRFGPNREELEQRQLVKLNAQTKADRISMAAIPLPYVVAQ